MTKASHKSCGLTWINQINIYFFYFIKKKIDIILKKKLEKKNINKFWLVFPRSWVNLDFNQVLPDQFFFYFCFVETQSSLSLDYLDHGSIFVIGFK
jgi:hypothetical protein